MRIVAGNYGGRTLKTLAGRTTRPTTDKIRGAIFNMLGQRLEGGRVLDLYAGSGALAIEAVSRGADAAVLVEKDRAAQSIIAENIAMTKEADKFQLLKMPADRALMQLAGKFDWIFLDPPYAKEKMLADMEKLAAQDLLSAAVVVVCETAKEIELPETVAQLIKKKEKVYGITRITIYGN